MALQLTRGYLEPHERAAALFRFVRDEIRYGFTSAFDAASPNETLRARRGHCNPQSVLFAALLRSIGIPARSHFVTIGAEILDGVFPLGGPRVLSHAYTEVGLEGRWLCVDAYCVDPPLFRAAQRRLAETGALLGWGVHRAGRSDWDGTHDAMAQLADPSMVLHDGGSYDDPARFYRSEAYANRFSVLDAGLYRWFGVDEGNRRLDALRASNEPLPRSA